MSIVEKAAEKLKMYELQAARRQKVEPTIVIQDQPDAPASVSTVERLHAHDSARPAKSDEAMELWHVDLPAMRQTGYLADGETESRLADELRRIKRPLLARFNGQEKSGAEHPDRIMVTSAVPMEGKTFTALNLAMSLAKELDIEVLLVDADIPKRDVSRLLKLQDHPGLMDALTHEQRHVGDLILRTDVPNLLVLPAGRHHALTTEVFNSLRMEQVLRELAGHKRRRVVVFDSSPLLATPDAQVLAHHVGQIVMVVAAGRTPQHAVKSALDSLDGGKSVNLLLNMARLPTGEGYYYPYYNSHKLKDR